jgi:hypothetical protein
VPIVVKQRGHPTAKKSWEIAIDVPNNGFVRHKDPHFPTAASGARTWRTLNDTLFALCMKINTLPVWFARGADIATIASNLFWFCDLANAIADPKWSPERAPAYEIVVMRFHDAVQNDVGHERQPDALFLENTCTRPRRLS